MKKTNVRSDRLTDDMLAVIEAQVGQTFSQKFVNLIT